MGPGPRARRHQRHHRHHLRAGHHLHRGADPHLPVPGRRGAGDRGQAARGHRRQEPGLRRERPALGQRPRHGRSGHLRSRQVLHPRPGRVLHLDGVWPERGRQERVQRRGGGRRLRRRRGLGRGQRRHQRHRPGGRRVQPGGHLHPGPDRHLPPPGLRGGGPPERREVSKLQRAPPL